MKFRPLVLVVLVLCAGCTSHRARSVLILDDTGAPLANATINLTYRVPYTVAHLNAGPTDKYGYARLPEYKITKESYATVTTADEMITFNFSQFGALKEGVLTLSTWRGTKESKQETISTDSLYVPSIYLKASGS